MDVLRTPDDRFADLPDFPYEPRYADVGGVRMGYVEAGDGPVVLCLHGEPSWSFLYRTMLPVLAAAGLRAIAPDLVGFGRSDKPRRVEDHSYAAHLGWVQGFIESLDLRGITLVGQDWGGLIGLRLAAEDPGRYARIVAANTGLPTGDQPMPQVWHDFKAAVQSAPVLDVARLVQAGCRTTLTPQVRAGYDAPFPTEEHKAGPRAMPGLVPITPDDPENAGNRAAWAALTRSGTPVLVAFSDGDPITAGMAPILKRALPGAAGRDHPTIAGAGHFLQEDAGPALARAVVDFVAST